MKWILHFWNRVSLNTVTDVLFYFKKCTYDISPLHFNIDVGEGWRSIPVLSLLWQHAPFYFSCYLCSYEWAYANTWPAMWSLDLNTVILFFFFWGLVETLLEILWLKISSLWFKCFSPYICKWTFQMNEATGINCKPQLVFQSIPVVASLYDI